MSILDSIIPLITLISLEIILGIDNIIFISILSDKLPQGERDKLRRIGLILAMFIRLALITVIAWVMKLQDSLFTILDQDISGKDIILLCGGVFLVYKSTKEIYHKTEEDETNLTNGQNTFRSLLVQILILDIVFSLDSIITAVGMVKELWIMYTAIIISVFIMLFASKPIGDFINKHPSFKVLALCFLITIGIALVGEGLDFHIPKGYIYFSMAFSFTVNVIQVVTSKPKKTS